MKLADDIDIDNLSDCDLHEAVVESQRLINQLSAQQAQLLERWNAPLCASASASGDLSTSRVDLLVRANRSSVRAEFERDEEMLLSMISGLSFSEADWAEAEANSR